MLAVFSPIFVVDAKIIFGYNFVAPLSNTGKQFLDTGIHQAQKETVCPKFVKTGRGAFDILSTDHVAVIRQKQVLPKQVKSCQFFQKLGRQRAKISKQQKYF